MLTRRAFFGLIAGALVAPKSPVAILFPSHTRTTRLPTLVFKQNQVWRLVCYPSTSDRLHVWDSTNAVVRRVSE